MNEKRYYWLKLEENYFDLKVQKALRKLPSGADMLICYLKMQLKYLNKSGLIEYQGIYEDLAQEIALDIDEDEDIVKMTLAILTKWKVIEQEDTNLYLSEMQGRIGSKSDVALRVAKHREKEKMLQCNNDVTKCNSIKEIDIEKDIEIDKENITKEKEIINYLNLKAHKNFKYTQNNLNKIKTRLKEGFTLEDFKQVIDKKCVEWLNDNKMNQYLRPETLFGSKFESYLQQDKNIVPTWVNKTYEQDIATPEEQEEMDNLLSEFN